MKAWEEELEHEDNIIKPAYVEEVAYSRSNRRLFRVIFHDKNMKEYVWVPRWRDVRWIYERALVFERKQYGNTKELKKLMTYVKNYAKLMQMLVKGVKNEDDLRTALRLYLEFYDEESYGKEHSGFGYKELQEFIDLLNLRKSLYDSITLAKMIKKILYEFELKGVVKLIGTSLLEGAYVFRGKGGD